MKTSKARLRLYRGDDTPPILTREQALANMKMSEPDRVGSWICTSTGGQFWPFDPRPDNIQKEDIAHSLSNMCRFAGHVRTFYSVAQHCVLVSILLESAGYPTEYVKAGLLHDASEAYLVDIPTPIKHDLRMQAYRETEDSVSTVIFEKFGLVYPYQNEIKMADCYALILEMRDLMPRGLSELHIAGLVFEDERALAMDAFLSRRQVTPKSPAAAKDDWLARFESLWG